MDEASQPNEKFVYSNDSLKNSSTEYSSNVVVTSKYTPMNFVFLFLFESFKKLANAYLSDYLFKLVLIWLFWCRKIVSTSAVCGIRYISPQCF